jgi:hypothetical protein
VEEEVLRLGAPEIRGNRENGVSESTETNQERKKK